MKKLKKSLLILAFSIPQLFSSASSLASDVATSSNVSLQASPLSSLLHASIVVQLTILILLSLSVLSWAIGWAKYKQFRSLKAANTEFDNIFWATSSLDSLYEKVDSFVLSSHARVFKAAYLEMKKIAESPMLNGNNSQNSERSQLTGLDNLERSLRKSSENEISESLVAAGLKS